MTVDLFDLPPLSGALVSECGTYRYKLWRAWDSHLPTCAFVMLNPSTADATDDDNTIRRCIGFAKRWGFGGILVANLFAYRATKPKELLTAQDPVGPGNDQRLVEVGRSCARVVVAWGAGCRWRGRRRQDIEALNALRTCRPNSEVVMCLGTTAVGFPRHPLYVKGNTEPVPYEAPR